MGRLLEIIAPLHARAHRDYVGRMTDEKVRCSETAREYGRDYWDGDRRYGYGGYRYDGRWEPVARRIAESYALPGNARILDVGCGKAHLLYELSRVLPNALVTGFDVSPYAIHTSKKEVRHRLFVHKAEEPYPFRDGQFALAISLMTLHNLPLPQLAQALAEIERVGVRKFVAVESYRSVEELFNLQCWALTCESFFRPEEWVWLFNKLGYTGDYEFLFFQ